jgi:tetratricopeptide (TPR) repeat protein
MKTKLPLLLIAFLAFGGALLGQSKGGGTPPPASGSGPGSIDPSGPQHAGDLGKYSNWDALVKQGRSGNYLGGKVAVQGGTLPWEPIAVTVLCDGKPRYTTYTDPKGGFLIAPKSEPGTLQTQADAKTARTAAFAGCAVQASLPGFESSTLMIANRSLLDNPDVGTVTLKREEGTEGGSLSGTSGSVPKDAVKSFEKARTEWMDKKSDRAQHDLEKAVQAYTQYAEAWYQLGKIQEASNSAEAWNCFTKSVAADPKFILPYSHLELLAAQAGKWQELLEFTTRELELNPRGSPEVWYYNSMANYNLNKKDVAEASANRALSMDPLHTVPNAEQLLAVILADKRDFAGALEHLRNCLPYLPDGPNVAVVKKQIAQLEEMIARNK